MVEATLRIVPAANEVRRGNEIGKTGSQSRNLYVSSACPACSKQHWVRLIKGTPRHSHCRPCANRKTQQAKVRHFLDEHPELKKMVASSEIKLGAQLGKTPATSQFVLLPCVDCGKKRWKQLKRGRLVQMRCMSCAGKVYASNHHQRGTLSHSWKGGKTKNTSGYIMVKIEPDHPYYSMARKQGYVLEHRLIVASKLGRPLLKTEQVHHINGIKDDNRPDNLKLVSLLDHNIRTELCSDCPLRREIRIVQLQNKTLLEQVRELNLRLMDSVFCDDKTPRAPGDDTEDE